jgi:hypothetical protein
VNESVIRESQVLPILPESGNDDDVRQPSTQWAKLEIRQSHMRSDLGNTKKKTKWMKRLIVLPHTALERIISCPDVYIQAAVKPDGTHYYEMLLVYVLHITHHKSLDQNKTMKEIRRIYQLKEGSVGEPTMNLAANVSCVYDDNGIKCGFYLVQTTLIVL